MKNKLIVLSALFLSILSSCSLGGKMDEEMTVSSFEMLNFSAPLEYVVTRGDHYSVKISGDRKLAEFIRVEVRNNTLCVDMKSNWNRRACRVKVEITLPVPLKFLAVDDLCKVNLNCLYDSSRFILKADDMSRVVLKGIKTDFFVVECEDMSKVKVQGEAREIEVECSDMSRVNLKKLVAQRGTCDCDDMSKAVVNVVDLVQRSRSMSKVENIAPSSDNRK